jgi:hypothetical protein
MMGKTQTAFWKLRMYKQPKVTRIYRRLERWRPFVTNDDTATCIQNKGFTITFYKDSCIVISADTLPRVWARQLRNTVQLLAQAANCFSSKSTLAPIRHWSSKHSSP